MGVKGILRKLIKPFRGNEQSAKKSGKSASAGKEKVLEHTGTGALRPARAGVRPSVSVAVPSGRGASRTDDHRIIKKVARSHGVAGKTAVVPRRAVRPVRQQPVVSVEKLKPHLEWDSALKNLLAMGAKEKLYLEPQAAPSQELLDSLRKADENLPVHKLSREELNEINEALAEVKKAASERKNFISAVTLPAEDEDLRHRLYEDFRKAGVELSEDTRALVAETENSVEEVSDGEIEALVAQIQAPPVEASSLMHSRSTGSALKQATDEDLENLLLDLQASQTPEQEPETSNTAYEDELAALQKERDQLAAELDRLQSEKAAPDRGILKDLLYQGINGDKSPQVMDLWFLVLDRFAALGWETDFSQDEPIAALFELDVNHRSEASSAIAMAWTCAIESELWREDHGGERNFALEDNPHFFRLVETVAQYMDTWHPDLSPGAASPSRQALRASGPNSIS